MPRVLYVPAFDSPDELVARVTRALASRPEGPVGVLVRAPEMPVRELLPALQRCRASTASTGALLFLRSRADLLAVVEGDALHLPSGGMTTEDARRVAPFALVGHACHDADELSRARDADYALLSPVFSVPGKSPPLGLAKAARLAREAAVPVLLLGGMTLEATEAAVRAGAHGVAVRRAVDDAPDPGEALRRFLSCVTHALAP